MQKIEKIKNKRGREKGFALIFAIVIMGVVASFTLYFIIMSRHLSALAKDYYYGTQARYLADAGVETVRAKIRHDAVRMPLIGLRVDGNNNGSWAEDIDVLAGDCPAGWNRCPRGLLDMEYSTRKDNVDENVSGTRDEATEIHPIPAGGQTGFYANVRDLGRLIDLNFSGPDTATSSTIATNALKYQLATFPLINEINTATDTLTTNGLVDAIINYRNNTLGGRFQSVGQLRSVTGMTDAIYTQIKPFLTVNAPSNVMSGGLFAHYFDSINPDPDLVTINYNTYVGSVIEKGAGGSKAGGSFDFHMYSALDFEGTQVSASSYLAATSNARTRTFVRPVILTNDASPGNPVDQNTVLTFGVRWDGFIFIPSDLYESNVSAPMVFRVRATGGARMKIAGEPVIKTSDFWNINHDGSETSTTFFQVSIAKDHFPVGWQPIEIEYWCNNNKPAFTLFWNQGYHRRSSTSVDVDMGNHKSIVPVGSLGYKSGGFYEIRSQGVVWNSAGRTESEKTVLTQTQLFGYLHDTLIRDFNQGQYARNALIGDYSLQNFVNSVFGGGQMSLKDTYPVSPMNTWFEFNEPFDSTDSVHRPNYDMIPNALKLGYWSNFDEVTDDATGGGFAAWKPRSGTTVSLRDFDSDGERELVVETSDNVTTDTDAFYWFIAAAPTVPNIPGVDLVGLSSGDSVTSPNASFTFPSFYWRFREYGNTGPIQKLANSNPSWTNVLEDYNGTLTNATNFNSDAGASSAVQAPDGGSAFGGPGAACNPLIQYKVEDKNCSSTVSQVSDSTQSYWVGQPLLHSLTNGDWPFYTEQYIPSSVVKADGTTHPSGKDHFQFRRNNGTVFLAQSSNGYTYSSLGYEWLFVKGRVSGGSDHTAWIYQNRPGVPAAGGDTALNAGYTFLSFIYDSNFNQNMTLGYRSIGNDSTSPRAIDSVRLLPATPQYQGLAGNASAVYNSRNLDAGSNVTWGIVNWLKFPSGNWVDSDGNTVSGSANSQVNLSYGTGTSLNPSPSTGISTTSPRGGMLQIPSSADNTRYFRYGIDFFFKQFDPVDLDSGYPPVFEDITVTYLTTPRTFYTREGVQGD